MIAFSPKPDRIRVSTANAEVPVYRFREENPEVPQKVRDALEKYLGAASSDEENNRGSIAAVAIKTLKEYCKSQIQTQHLSVLRISKTQEKRPWRSGSDSRVFTHNTDRYVFKYSVLGHKSSPEMVEYYRKKYKILKILGLEEHIPQSVFFFGETRRSFDDANPSASVFPQEVAITIQRRIHGKTFAEMSPEERSRPDVVHALREAHRKYIAAKAIVASANAHLGKRRFGVDIALNLGNISDRSELSESFIARKCKSPNIVYDEARKKVYFVDFDYGTWSPDKEEVFRFLVATPLP